MARTQLSGKYGVFVLAQVIINVITSMIAIFMGTNAIISLLITLISSLITSVLTFGITRMSLSASRNLTVNATDIFYGFKHHPDRIILLNLALAGMGFVCLIPGYALIMVSVVSIALSSSYMAFTAALIFGVILLIVGLVFLVIISLTFSQATFLMADNDTLGPIQSLKISHQIMKGHKGSMFYLGLSFIGMNLLGLITLGIGMLWIYPYITVTQANFYRDLTNDLSRNYNRDPYEQQNQGYGQNPYEQQNQGYGQNPYEQQNQDQNQDQNSGQNQDNRYE